MPGVRRTGVILCLVSAAAFGGIGIFGKLAYGEGSTVGTLLSVRFTVAAMLLWVLTASTGALAGMRRMPRRDVVAALALGALGYGAQAGAYLAPLGRLGAGRRRGPRPPGGPGAPGAGAGGRAVPPPRGGGGPPRCCRCPSPPTGWGPPPGRPRGVATAGAGAPPPLSPWRAAGWSSC